MHASTAIWAVCTIATSALVVLLHATGTAVQRESLAVMAGIVLTMICLHCIYSRMRPDLLIAAATGGLAALLWAGLAAGMMALAGLRAGATLIDGELAYADALLGIDTQELTIWTARHPWSGKVLMFSYVSTVPVLFAAAMLLACAKQSTRMWYLCLDFTISANFCALLSSLVPANGAFIHYGIAPNILLELPHGAGVFHMHVVEAYRSGARMAVDVFQLEGGVTFPSFHTAMAVMTAYAVRGMGWITIAALIWCGLVIASTVPIGGHYMIDLVAGLATWAAFAYLARSLSRPHISCAI